eukprot:403342150
MFIRHGERADKHPERNIQFEERYDAQLTPIGEQQAIETGQFLKEYIKTGNFEEILIESSPFLRVIMTSANIARQIGINHIPINYDYREYLESSSYNHQNPIPRLLINKYSQEEISQKYLNGMTYKFVRDYQQNDIEQMFPEDNEIVLNRVLGIAQNLAAKYSQSDKRVLHIIVTHGHLVRSLALQHGGQEQRFLYCNKTALEVQNGLIKKLLFDSDDSHVITKY